MTRLLSRLIRRLLRDAHGGVAVLAAFALPVMLGFAAFAVDMGMATLDARRLQGVADAAALAAASDPIRATELANASLASSGWGRKTDLTVTVGRYAADPATPIGGRFVAADPRDADAARVTLASRSPVFFATMFGFKGIAIARNATAARERLASLSIGSRLAAVQGGVVNGYLSALTGSNISLSLVSYDALASADVDLFGFLGALRTQANLTALTYGQIVDARVTQAQVLDALSTSLAGKDASTAAILHTLSTQVGGNRSLALSTLIDPGPYANQASGGEGLARINAMAAVTAVLQLASPSRQVAFDLGANAGIASTRVTLAIGQRPTSSPWISITAKGTPIVRTAQVRLYAESNLGTAALPGLAGLATVRAPLFMELASGEARLTSIDCASLATRGVSVEARTNPGLVALGSVDTSTLDDFTRPVTVTPAKLVDTLLVDVTGQATVDLGAAESWQPLRFDADRIKAGTPLTVSSSAPTQGVAASLMSKAQLTAHVLGIPIPVGPLLSAVGNLLGTVAPAIDGLLDTLTGTLGVHYGQADVRVTGMRCGVAALVG